MKQGLMKGEKDNGAPFKDFFNVRFFLFHFCYSLSLIIIPFLSPLLQLLVQQKKKNLDCQWL